VSSNKSFSAETANRYALALYEIAVENSELETVEKNIKELLAAYDTSKELKNFIKDPTQSQSSQLEVLNQILVKMNLSKIIKNFLSILVVKRRIFFLNSIFLNFLSLISKKRGELKASLISSKDLTNDELKNLNNDLSQSMGTSVAFDYKVDETLIGGLKMQIGSLMIDTSIKNKLKKYEQIMLEV
jgi:F-type H+-transporting ATPase subunit delta|tara:strand:- start:631 stop:1188 length:558 start_codon:yes stop_codon:yes gene_type:complete